MKSIALIILINLALLGHIDALAGSEADTSAEQPSFWSKIWQDFKKDWVKIGNEAKESGVEAGRSFKEEAKEMPENFRKGWEKAREDFKNGTGTPNESRSDH